MRITEKEYLEALDIVKNYRKQIDDDCLIALVDAENIIIEECDISVRLINCLKYAELNKLKLIDFKNFSKSELMSISHFGKKTLTELEEILLLYGVELKKPLKK